MNNESLVIAGKSFKSRLLIGTGKFPSNAVLREVLEISEAEIVTVAMGRADIETSVPTVLDAVDRDKYLLLPNTSGARTAEEAVRLAGLAKAGGAGNWVKLEVTPDPNYLLPDPIETLKAADI